MSRCFPFPPPGYERKPTTDEPDLLKKEKRKEKKHKKDKKDKEKRDGKEKREKDRSQGKHKDKKGKHRDKKKDKEKGKSSNSDEKRVYGQFEGHNGDKLHHIDEHNKEKGSSSSDKKSSVQFQNGECNEQLHRKEEFSKEKSSSSDDKKSSTQFRGQNGELARNRITAEDAENFKFVQELDRRIRDEEKGTGSHQFVVEGRKNSVNKVEIQKTGGRQAITDEASFGRNAMVQNKINGTTLPPLDNKVDRRIEEKEKMQEKGDNKRGDKRKNKDRDKQRRGKDKDMEKEKREEKAKEKSEQKKVERDKNRHIKKSDTSASLNNLSAHPPESSFQGVGGSEGNFKKRKDMGTNGVSHENEPRPNKMARHISNISPENGRKLDFLQNLGSSLLDKQGASQGASLNSFKVGGKDQRVNGMISSQPVSVSATKPTISAVNHVASKPTPIKSPPVITSHVAAQSPPVPTVKPQPSVPNHIAAQPPLMPTTKPPPSIPNHIAAQLPPLSSTPPPQPSTTAKQPVSQPKLQPKVAASPLPIPKKKSPAAAEASMKPPHPDTKYLKQILSVPKLEPWCGFDDQEWLFSSKEDHPSSKKTTMEDLVQDNKELQVQVWSEARHIESVDVCALPYVIPY